MAQAQGEPVEGADEITVKDDEDYVAKRIKARILDSRERVDDREDALFTEPLVDPEITLNPQRATVAWGNTVRQFLRNIEVLLRRFPSDDPRGRGREDTDRAASSDDGAYYLNTVPLGEVTLMPPDTRGYQFSRVAALGDGEFDEDLLKKDLGLPRKADLPRPATVGFEGLRSVIERDSVISKQWRVCVEAGAGPAAGRYETIERSQPVPKWIYDNAVRAADLYLNDIGIGVNVDDSGQDTIRGFDQSGDEPQGEYSEEKFSGEVSL